MEKMHILAWHNIKQNERKRGLYSTDTEHNVLRKQVNNPQSHSDNSASIKWGPAWAGHICTRWIINCSDFPICQVINYCHTKLSLLLHPAVVLPWLWNMRWATVVRSWYMECPCNGQSGLDPVPHSLPQPVIRGHGLNLLKSKYTSFSSWEHSASSAYTVHQNEVYPHELSHHLQHSVNVTTGASYNSYNSSKELLGRTL